MKFSEYIKEEREITLIGRKINGKFVTPETRNDNWVGSFSCINFKITTLVGAPKEVSTYFDCSENNLTSLEGSPQKVGTFFSCTGNKLKTLKGGPEEVGGIFYCSNNKLTSLEGAPKIVNTDFDCTNNNLTNFKDIHKIIQRIDGVLYCANNPITSHVLGLLLISRLKHIVYTGAWVRIVNNYLGQGRDGLINCQNELIDAGLEEFAQL